MRRRNDRPGPARLFHPVLAGLILCAALALAVRALPARAARAAGDATGDPEAETVTFAISGYRVEGATLLTADAAEGVLARFTGPAMDAQAVERARDALEKFYHRQGYPTVLVNIPEQSVDDGIVRLKVIESKIRQVRITGNRYFSRDYIREELPSFRPGVVPYVPDLQADLGRIAGNPDIRVEPLMTPARELGFIDIELKVKDKLPLHGSLELNNRGTHTTTALRVNGSLRYDHLWQRRHSVSFQFQTSPQETDEVKVLAGSYVLPAPWNAEDRLAFYGVASDSDTGFGDGFAVIGKGFLVGGRWIVSLPPAGSYYHNLTVGLDYKDFDETLRFGADETVTPIEYMPFSFSYAGVRPDKWGTTQFSGGLNMTFRGVTADREQFEIKRFNARGNFLYATAGIERQQKLPFGFRAYAKADGQLANEPLVSNEQYAAGGRESVRGYKESEALGDNAWHVTFELALPDLVALVREAAPLSVVPYAFYDAAWLETKSPLPDQASTQQLAGAGAGIRGNLTKRLTGEVAWGYPLSDTADTATGDWGVYYAVRAVF